MLPQTNRLQKKKDIDQVFKEGKGLKEDFLVLKTNKNGFKKSRFGFIVSQKVSNKATLRNKIKRRLRELVQKRMNLIKPGTDNILVALPGLENKDFWEMEEIVDKLLKKAKLI